MQVFKQLRSSESTRNTFKNVRHPARRFTRQQFNQLQLYTIEIRIINPFVQLISTISTPYQNVQHIRILALPTILVIIFASRISALVVGYCSHPSRLPLYAVAVLQPYGAKVLGTVGWCQSNCTVIIEEQMLKAETTKLRTKNLCELGPSFQRRDQ